MIYEIRTYGIAPGSLAEVEKRFAEGYEIRKKHSELAAFWHTEIGPLNEIIHVWPYQDPGERARVRAESVKDPGWPPKIGDFIRTMHSEILVPLPFLPPLRPGKLGPFFEMRTYTIKPGTASEIVKGWEARVPERIKLSPLVIAGMVDVGEVNRFIQIWGYSSMNEREEVRARAAQMGIWPPKGAPGSILTQANKIVVPAAFSPLQ